MGMVGWISQLLALGGLSGARPFLTLGILAAYARYTLGLREELWLTNDLALGLCLVLSIVEHLVRTDADVEEWLGGPLAILSALSGAMAASLLLALGEEPADWEAAYGGSPPDALQEISSVTEMGMMGLSGASAVGVQWARPLHADCTRSTQSHHPHLGDRRDLLKRIRGTPTISRLPISRLFTQREK